MVNCLPRRVAYFFARRLSLRFWRRVAFAYVASQAQERKIQAGGEGIVVGFGLRECADQFGAGRGCEFTAGCGVVAGIFLQGLFSGLHPAVQAFAKVSEMRCGIFRVAVVG
jgi:hypothetical protein